MRMEAPSIRSRVGRLSRRSRRARYPFKRSVDLDSKRQCSHSLAWTDWWSCQQNIITDPLLLGACRNVPGSVKLMVKPSSSTTATVRAVKLGKCPACGKLRYQKLMRTKCKFNSALPSIQPWQRCPSASRKEFAILSKRSRTNAAALVESDQRYVELEQKYKGLLLRDLS